ncbi:MAG: hypothetical protein LBQ47_07280 [Endomicrobium sp.]|jgi:uncharacterized protein (UPF0333 family)|nr:hypothetical protein [Endomicrobium sp.]
MLNRKGQTFVEFLLVFAVLLAAASGAFALYKSAWKKRYVKTGIVSGAAAAIVSGVNSSGSAGYVK